MFTQLHQIQMNSASDIYSASSWYSVLAYMKKHQYGVKVKFDKGQLPLPLTSGFYQSIGLPYGQKSDFRLPLSNGSGLHVHEYDNYYEVHIDRVDPSCNLIGHMVHDAPRTFLIGASLVGASFGLATKNKMLGIFALGGLTVGLLTMCLIRSENFSDKIHC